MSYSLSFLIVVLCVLSILSRGFLVHKFAEIAIKICYHFLEKYDCFRSFDMILAGEDFFFEQFDDTVTGFGHVLRDFCLVAIKGRDDGIVWLGFGLHGIDDFELCSSGGDYTLIG